LYISLFLELQSKLNKRRVFIDSVKIAQYNREPL
jgi:hypothetical protein